MSKPFQFEPEIELEPTSSRGGGGRSSLRLPAWLLVAFVGYLAATDFYSRVTGWFDAKRLREIKDTIPELSARYEADKFQWARETAKRELKAKGKKPGDLEGVDDRLFSLRVSELEAMYYETDEGKPLYSKMFDLRSEYRALMWKHPDWPLASDAFPVFKQ